MDYNQMALELHEKHQGKIAVVSKVEVADSVDLSVAYTPGVAEPCRKIAENKEEVYRYTSKGNLVAVVTDGTAVLGLGDIGPEAALPVMEGKAILFKTFANVDAFPICLATKDVDEIVHAVKLLEPVFGGINLEDISAPRCFEIERRLKEELDIPVFHDDQHGTAIVVLAALINACKLTGRKFSELDVVISGAGSAGLAIAELLLERGVGNIVVCDRRGALSSLSDHANGAQRQLMPRLNKRDEQGSLAEVLSGKDVFIGVSGPNILNGEAVAAMADKAIVLAMANPIPEIMPDEALKAGAYIVGTGRSDFANQVNNVLAFPGIFRGALDVRARDINMAMKIAAAEAIAATVDEDLLTPEYVLPKAFDPQVAKNVADAVRKAAVDSGVAR
ncbi:MAG: NADP-dependent malic enzyme [Acidaminobacter sp.]|nr:NADP-dependent malic enzyme [Acidaminobacter sp.]MDK9712166.1 NADP-dependent malic enzyme [Acidaminobacter sp.]MZQ96183.1 NAD-dependent malic enzyme [Acidaminobacter sp.]